MYYFLVTCTLAAGLTCPDPKMISDASEVNYPTPESCQQTANHFINRVMRRQYKFTAPMEYRCLKRD